MILEELKKLLLESDWDEEEDFDEVALVLIDALRQYSDTDLDDSRETFNYLLKCLKDLVVNGVDGAGLGE